MDLVENMNPLLDCVLYTVSCAVGRNNSHPSLNIFQIFWCLSYLNSNRN